MMWCPEKEWAGETVFIIGGGPSLKDFNFHRLAGKKTIGCNDAFHLGKGIVHTVVFGDASWFHRRKFDLENFGGRVVTCAPQLMSMKAPWLFTMRRERHGLGTRDTLGWNYSTGAAAINLAILFGAGSIYLLGFDLGLSADGKAHWHNHNGKITAEDSFTRFLRGFQRLQEDVAKLPVRIYNVTNGSSRLSVFERTTFAEFDRVL